MTVSPLAPKGFPQLPRINGVTLATAASEMKYRDRDDMLLMRLVTGATVAGVFTRSDTAAAPVAWCRERLEAKTDPRAVLVNAGNANAFTGTDGMAAVERCCEGVATQLGCGAGEILMASTGVIGEPLDTGILAAQFGALSTGEADWQQAARAIMTTDTYEKGAAATAEIDGVPVAFAGIAKGSGMIAPDMATMLAFIATDAAIPADVLASLLRRSTATSFNAITVDSDSSTNDSVLFVASGVAEHRPVTDADDPALESFRTALDTVMKDLAQQIVRDGEGATKFVTITVTGATDDDAARRIGMAIANSPLVKTAIAGEDANWGRIVMAVGKAGEGVDQSRISVSIGGVLIAADGARVDGYDEAPVAAHMAGQNIAVDVSVGGGAGGSQVWTCDLTHGYISINADYRS